jgi:hypothetical protein
MVAAKKEGGGSTWNEQLKYLAFSTTALSVIQGWLKTGVPTKMELHSVSTVDKSYASYNSKKEERS